MFFPSIREGGSSFVQHRPQKSPDEDVGRFFALFLFEQREKLDQFGIELGSFD